MAVVSFDYEPRVQFESFHRRNQRWASLVVHRRGGKTVACVNELLTRASYTSKKDARYAYIAPFYRQAKDVAWEYIKQFGKGVIKKIRESELRIELFNGAWITLYGADNPDALRGLYLDGVVLDEYGDCRPSLWGQVVLPTLADRKGWAVFIGTPKGKNHFYEIAKRAESDDKWFYLNLPASQSGIIDEEELLEMKAQQTPEEYQQEMECDFTAAVKGTYYAETVQQMEASGRISKGACTYDPVLPVNVASDIGFTDSSAWWFWQDTAEGPNIIDYYEANQKNMQHYFDMLRGKGYNYGTIYLPHDAKANTFQTGRSTEEQFIAEFRDDDVSLHVIPRLARQHGIDAARLVLPRCTIDSDKCYEGVEALRAYRRKYDEVAKCYSKDPAHDWSSHGADGFRYLSLVCKDSLNIVVNKPLEKKKQPKGYTLEDLHRANANGGARYRFQKLRV